MGVSKVVFGNDTVMDITDSTVTSNNLLSGEIAYGANGDQVVGSYTPVDEKVSQENTTTNADYRILFSKSANDTTETETARKNTNLKYNPSTGNLQTTKINGVTVGDSPKFTDTNTKVTSVSNHYSPSEDSSAQLDADASGGSAATWNSTQLVTGVTIKRDAKGHVTGVGVDSIKLPANPNTNTTYTFASGTTNGAFQVTPSTSGATAQTVSIYGLGSAAYTNSTAYATSEHTHGNITNDGKVSSDVTIANGDKLLITDASDSNKVVTSSITFNGSTTTQCLTRKGTWATFSNNSGTVTSVTINATSPIVIDDSTAITGSGTRTISHATSGATAATYGDSGNQTPNYGGTFKVPTITVNDTGHITGISTHTVKIPASDNTDKDVLQTELTVSNTWKEIALAQSNSTDTETAGLFKTSGFSIQVEEATAESVEGTVNLAIGNGHALTSDRYKGTMRFYNNGVTSTLSSEAKTYNNSVTLPVQNGALALKTDIIGSLIQQPYYTSSGTSNNVTRTVNSNGSVSFVTTADGASANTNYYFKHSNHNFKLPAGTYLLKGCPAGGASNKYYLQVGVYDGSSTSWLTPQDFGDGTTFTLSQESVIQLIFSIRKNCVITSAISVTPFLIYDIQSNWSETDAYSNSYIKNKPQNLVQDASYVHTDNNFTTALKNKVDGITSTNKASTKLFLVGALAQGTTPETYSNSKVYIGTDNCLYSNNTKVLTAHQDISGKVDKTGDTMSGGLNVNCQNGTTSTVGLSQITLGNNIASGTAKNSKGVLALMSDTTYGASLVADSLTANRYITLPDVDSPLAYKGESLADFDNSTTKFVASDLRVRQTFTNDQTNKNYSILFSYSEATETRKDEQARKGQLYFNPYYTRIYFRGTNYGYMQSSGVQTLHLAASDESDYRLFLGVNENSWNLSPSKDHMLQLGSANFRWGQIYSTNSSINTSDREQKKDIADLTEDSKTLIMSLKPVSYKFKEGTSGRTHYGLIAQDIEKTLEDLNMTPMDFAGFCKDQKVRTIMIKEKVIDDNGNVTDDEIDRESTEPIEGEYVYGLRYEEFIAPLIKTVQLQQQEIEQLKQRIEILEGGQGA